MVRIVIEIENGNAQITRQASEDARPMDKIGGETYSTLIAACASGDVKFAPVTLKGAELIKGLTTKAELNARELGS